MTDLFGYTPPPSYEQGELGGPTIHVGPKCRECGKGLVETESGFNSCPLGHGKLRIPEGMRPAQFKNVSIPVWSKA